MDTYGGKVHRQATRKLHTPLGGLDELRDVGMAWVEAGVGVDDADDGAGEGVVGVSQSFDEDFAEEEGEVGVTVGGEALAHAGAVDGLGEVVVFHGWDGVIVIGMVVIGGGGLVYLWVGGGGRPTEVFRGWRV